MDPMNALLSSGARNGAFETRCLHVLESVEVGVKIDRLWRNSNATTLDFIPSNALPAIGEHFTGMTNKLIKVTPSTSSEVKLGLARMFWLFWRLVLLKPKSTLKHSSLASLLIKRLRDFSCFDDVAIVKQMDNVLVRYGSPSSITSSASLVKDRRLRGVSKLINKGLLSKSMASLVSDGVAPLDENCINQLISKHPSRKEEINVSPQAVDLGESVADEDIDEEVLQRLLYKAINSAKKGSSPGHSGNRVEHWKAQITNEASPKSVYIMSWFMDGSAFTEFVQLGRNVTLMPLVKSPSQVRPIAIGESMRRLGA